MSVRDVTATAGGAGFKADPIGTGAAVIRLELRMAGIDPRRFPPGLFGELAEHCLGRARRAAAAAPGPAVAERYAEALEDVARAVAMSIRGDRRLV